MPAAYTTTGNPSLSICEIVDQHAGLIDNALVDVQITSNGTLTLTQSDGSSFTNSIPYFSDFVISGIQLSGLQSPNGLTLNYTSGTYQINANQYTIATGGTLTLTAGDLTNDRIDVVYLTTSNTIVLLTGTPSATPVQPTPPANTLIVGIIGVPANTTALSGGAVLTLQNTTSSNNITNGTLTNNTLRWNNSLGKWVENSNFKIAPSTDLFGGYLSGLSGVEALGGLYASGTVTVGNAIQKDIAPGTQVISIMEYSDTSANEQTFVRVGNDNEFSLYSEDSNFTYAITNSRTLDNLTIYATDGTDTTSAIFESGALNLKFDDATVSHYIRLNSTLGSMFIDGGIGSTNTALNLRADNPSNPTELISNRGSGDFYQLSFDYNADTIRLRREDSGDFAQLLIENSPLSIKMEVDATSNIFFKVDETGISSSILPEYADDAAAAAGSLPIGYWYRTGSVCKQRIS